MPRGKAIRASLMDYGRDGLGLGLTGITTAATTGLTKALIGAAMIWVSPKIAKTPAGKTFNRYWALLNAVDGGAEAMLGAPGVY